jgi:hypothetical protein
MSMKTPRAVYSALLFGVSLLFMSPAWAQVKQPLQRIRELEEGMESLEGLEARVKELEEKLRAFEADQDRTLPQGFLTLGGETFQIGGKLEINTVDVESERDPVVGTTDNPDPHLEFDVLRLEPRIDVNDEISIQAQLDFTPDRARLKEGTIRHLGQPVWWFRSDARLGLDDRFIRVARDTETYPLIGTAFWRDEELAFWWSFRFGDKDGPPGTTAGARPPAHAFDFRRNAGALELHFSIGDGYALGEREIGSDEAPFDVIVQDDRNTDGSLALRNVGLGLGYSRSFLRLGEASFLGFYYNDELSSDSKDFLQQELTVRSPGGAAVAGYGDSEKDSSYRYGLGGEYFLPAKSLFGREARGNDGLKVKAQWIEGKDGDLRRDGWFVQGSYRYSFPRRLLADRYLRAIEPVIRYGEFDVDLDPDPRLPGTWDREALLINLNTYITNDIILRVEYTFNDEDTGAGAGNPGPSSVDNDQLLVQLRVNF